ncbi:hypothetical protein N8D56_23980 [Devosia sp. A8/3-2]|nr:hypothetical protein N8D56_23980 [Devosia sp. A8/3-2]
MAPTSPSTFAFGRFLLTLFVGPAPGALTFLLGGALADWQDNPDRWPDVFEDAPPVLLFGYGMGLFPAPVGAIAMGVFSHRYQNLRAQILAAIPLGAAAGWFGMTLFVSSFGANKYFNMELQLISTIAGAVALLGCTALFCPVRHPAPQGRILMHLLSARAGAIQQEGEAIDLNQRPGAYIFASAADSELAMLAGAADRAGESELRLANTLRLSNNLSVDLWLEQTVAHASSVVLRLIGGAAYFQYGVDELTALCANRRIPLALIPGDANPDPILQSRSTIHPEDWTRLHTLFIAGGPDNADTILKAFKLLSSPLPLGERSAAQQPGEGALLVDLQPTPFARFGLWHPTTGITDEAGLHSIHAALSLPSPLRGGTQWGSLGPLHKPAPTSPSSSTAPP